MSDEVLRQRLESDERVLFAFLFGSRARGRERSDSDWDVGVFLGLGLDATERFAFRRHAIAALEPELRVDLVVLNDAPPLVAHRALLGRPLFIRDRAAYVRFFVRTLALAGDQRHWDRLHAESRHERLREGAFGRP